MRTRSHSARAQITKRTQEALCFQRPFSDVLQFPNENEYDSSWGDGWTLPSGTPSSSSSKIGAQRSSTEEVLLTILARRFLCGHAAYLDSGSILPAKAA